MSFMNTIYVMFNTYINYFLNLNNYIISIIIVIYLGKFHLFNINMINLEIKLVNL